MLHSGQGIRAISNPSMKVALIAIFTALALGTNYAMIDLWNVKLMDALVFIAAFLFGLRVGLGSAVSIWLVYGFINPYGQADPVLLGFLITGECFYAVAGLVISRSSVAKELLSKGRLISKSPRDTDFIKIEESGLDGLKTGFRRINNKIRAFLRRVYFRVLPYGRLSILFGIIGFQATFAYDVLTNFGSWIFKTTSLYQALIIGIITGLPFAILHEASNLLFFATVVPVAIVAARRLGLTTQERVS